MVEDPDARLRGRMRQEYGFEEDLIGPVRRLRRGPPAIRSTGGGISRIARWNRNPRKLDSGRGRPKRDIVREIRRKADAPHALRDTEAPKDFHRAGGDVIAAYAGRF